MVAVSGLLLVRAPNRALDLVGRSPASSLALAREAMEELHASTSSSWRCSGLRAPSSVAAAAQVHFRGDGAWLVAASRRRFVLPGLDPPRARLLGRDRRAIGVDSCRSSWAVRLGLAWPACAAAGLVCSGLVEEAAPSIKSGVLLSRLRLCHVDTFSGVDGKPVESCTGVLGPALVTRAVAVAAGERFGGPALGWWFVVADLVILLRLRRSEVPELEPRICTGSFPGRRATAATPRRSRWGSSSTQNAVSGDGVPSVQGLVVPGVFLCCSSRRRRRRSKAGVGSFCVKAPQGPDCTFSFFGGLSAFVLGHLWSLGDAAYVLCL